MAVRGRPAVPEAGAALYLSAARLSAAPLRLRAGEFCPQTDLGGKGFLLCGKYGVSWRFFSDRRAQGLTFPGNGGLLSATRPGHGSGRRRGLKALFTHSFTSLSCFCLLFSFPF